MAELIELGSILHMEKGKKPKKQTQTPADGYLPYVDIKAFEEGIINSYATTENSLTCEDGDLLIVCDGSRSGLTGIAIKGVVGSTLSKIYADGMTTNYLRYYVQSKYTLLNTRKKGTGTPHLNAEILKKSKLIVPPIAEQERIVAKIEELFSQLDKAIQTLQTVKQQLSIYRQSVLKSAFEGKFTDKWRKNNAYNIEDILSKIKTKNSVVGFKPMLESYNLPAIPSEWKWVSIGDISTGAEYGSSKKSKKTGTVPVLRMGNIQNGQFVMDDLVYSDDPEEISKYQLKKGDVLFNRTNSSDLVGKTAAFTDDTTTIFAGYLIRVNQVPEIDYRYLTMYLNSQTAKGYGNKVKTDGVNQSNINSKKLYSYPFPLCCIEEQKEIIYILESRLSVCDSIEKTVDDALLQAEALRQSILKQAFEGELI